MGSERCSCPSGVDLSLFPRIIVDWVSYPCTMVEWVNEVFLVGPMDEKLYFTRSMEV
jgi:hypothetical protein